MNRVAPDDALLTLLQHAQGALDFQVPTITDALTGGDQAYDGPFYRLRSPLNVVDRVDVPTFVVGGEYDLFQRGEPMLYDALRRNGVPTRLLIGPWNHVQAAAGPGLPDGKVPSLDVLALRWLDRYVRGDEDPALASDVKPVTYYEIGSGKWRTASRWLPGSVSARTYQLDGAAAPGSPGVLTPDAVTETARATTSTRSPSPACAPAAPRSGPRASPRSPAARPTTSSTTSSARPTRPRRSTSRCT